MNAIVFAVQAPAIALQTAMDSQLGYPHAGVDAGAGRHVSGAQGSTTHAAGVIAHPSGLQWALQESPEILAAEGQVPIGAGVRGPLGADWFP